MRKIIVDSFLYPLNIIETVEISEQEFFIDETEEVFVCQDNAQRTIEPDVQIDLTISDDPALDCLLPVESHENENLFIHDLVHKNDCSSSKSELIPLEREFKPPRAAKSLKRTYSIFDRGSTAESSKRSKK